jgi:hypothetical protein
VGWGARVGIIATQQVAGKKLLSPAPEKKPYN